MRLLVLASTYPLGAGDTTPGFVHELCKRLVARGHTVVVLTPHLPGAAREQSLDGVWVKRFRYANDGFEQLIGPGGVVSRVRAHPWRVLLVPLLLAALAWELRRETARAPYDLIHAHWLIPQGLVAALMRRWLPPVPLVCTAHGGDLFALRGPRFRWLRSLIVRRSAAVTLVSHYMRDVLVAEGASPEQLTVASMGADLEHQFVEDTTVTRASQQVIFVGRLVEKKGVHHLLGAFRHVVQRVPTARLTIVGDGPERARLDALCDSLQLRAHVEFLGAKPPSELPALYARAAIAVVPSIVDRGGDQEGLGLVTIEATGCGCAVVVSDLAAIRDVVKHGETGLVTPAGDEQALAAAIVELLGDEAARVRLADAARAHALARFDWRVVTTRYESLFEGLLARPTT